MKNYYVLFVLLALLTSCKDMNKTTEDETLMTDEPTLEGAWELVSFLNYDSDGAADTINSSNDYKQMKMYSKSKIMWSRLRAGDSLDWFGVGNYTFKDGILTEVLDYGSKAMNNRIKDNSHFQFEIEITDTTFTQIEVDSLGHRIYAETYKRIE